jgi:hypothetical protein
MITSLKYQGVILGDRECWLKESENTQPSSARVSGVNAFVIKNHGSWLNFPAEIPFQPNPWGL